MTCSLMMKGMPLSVAQHFLCRLQRSKRLRHACLSNLNRRMKARGISQRTQLLCLSLSAPSPCPTTVSMRPLHVSSRRSACAAVLLQSLQQDLNGGQSARRPCTLLLQRTEAHDRIWKVKQHALQLCSIF